MTGLFTSRSVSAGPIRHAGLKEPLLMVSRHTRHHRSLSPIFLWINDTFKSSYEAEGNKGGILKLFALGVFWRPF